MSNESFLYLVTRGRNTGQPRDIEIWFVERGRFYIVAEKREQTHWVKNVRAHAEVSFSVGSRSDRESHAKRTAARARVLDGPADTGHANEIRRLMDEKYGWSDGLVVEIAPGA